MSQPVDVYPYPVIKSQPDSSHSNGSYGPVLIVLGAIAALGVISCVLGRLCNRRHGDDKKEQHHHHHQVHHQPPPNSVNATYGQGRELGPKEWEAKDKPRISLRDRADVEFGFDKKIPSGRVGEQPRFDGGRRPDVRFDGGRRPEVRFADNV